jgi:acylphosphatase
MRRIRFVVTGRVQGVGFRAYTQVEACRLGLIGFVQNRRDGAVDGEAQGAPERVAEFVQWLHRGPRWANVESVATGELAVADGEVAFEVRR